MKRVPITLFAVLVLLAVLFCTAAWGIPFTRNDVFWTSFVFSLLALVLEGGLLWGEVRKANMVKAWFFTYPVFYLSLGYLVLQFLSAGVFMTFSTHAPLWAAFFVNVLLLGTYGISLLLTNLGRQEVTRLENRVQQKVRFLRGLRAELESLLPQVEDGELKNVLRKLSELVLYSDPMSSDALRPLEEKIQATVEQLHATVVGGDSSAALALSVQMQELMEQRNRHCLQEK
ncbi:MAG: hypothetical protein Q4D98_08945 [Planctomycetia bacterium]|nr:hypothetical protein [Planctomycetia bacterium]